MRSNKDFSSKWYGHFGHVFEWRYRNKLLAHYERTNHHEIVYLFNKKVFIRPLHERYTLNNTFNFTVQPRNLRILDQLDNNRPRILFIAQFLSKVGGAESRLLSLFQYLKTKDIEPVLLTQQNDCPPLREFPNLILNFESNYFPALLEELVILGKFQVIEFQFLRFRYIYDLNIEKLLSLAKVGFFVHNLIYPEAKLSQILNKFSYKLSSQYRKKPVECERIPNWINSTEPIHWHYNNQNKALLVTRNTKDKLWGIQKFINICRSHHLDFEIATPLPLSPHAQKLKDKLQISDSQFIGAINTLPFLNENGQKYLFIAGIGQVPLEAASIGCPAMVLASDVHPNKSTILCNDNLNFLNEWNFVINECPDHNSLGNLETFLKSLQKGAPLPSEYQVLGKLEILRSRKVILDRYMNVVFDQTTQG